MAKVTEEQRLAWIEQTRRGVEHTYGRALVRDGRVLKGVTCTRCWRSDLWSGHIGMTSQAAEIPAHKCPHGKKCGGDGARILDAELAAAIAAGDPVSRAHAEISDCTACAVLAGFGAAQAMVALPCVFCSGRGCPACGNRPSQLASASPGHSHHRPPSADDHALAQDLVKQMQAEGDIFASARGVGPKRAKKKA